MRKTGPMMPARLSTWATRKMSSIFWNEEDSGRSQFWAWGERPDHIVWDDRHRASRCRLAAGYKCGETYILGLQVECFLRLLNQESKKDAIVFWKVNDTFVFVPIFLSLPHWYLSDPIWEVWGDLGEIIYSIYKRHHSKTKVTDP